MKLTAKQLEVLKLMNEGWELGLSDESYWLQRDGCGRGGQMQNVNANTANGLRSKGLIVIVRQDFALIIRFALTEAGKKALEEA